MVVVGGGAGGVVKIFFVLLRTFFLASTLLGVYFAYYLVLSLLSCEFSIDILSASILFGVVLCTGITRLITLGWGGGGIDLGY
jgi:hypothetical protein